MAEFETFLDAAQVAEKLGLSVATIRKWVLTGFIPYKKIGRAVRFSAAEIQAWAQGKSVKPVQPETAECKGGVL
jgi:excisionase family DNA binding protein